MAVVVHLDQFRGDGTLIVPLVVDDVDEVTAVEHVEQLAPGQLGRALDHFFGPGDWAEATTGFDRHRRQRRWRSYRVVKAPPVGRWPLLDSAFPEFHDFELVPENEAGQLPLLWYRIYEAGRELGRVCLDEGQWHTSARSSFDRLYGAARGLWRSR